jgi:hypothetical protein
MSDQKASKAVVVHQPPRYLANIPIFDDAEQLAERTIDRTMNAQSPEEALADPDSGSLRDFSGQAITITQVLGIMPSTINEGDFYIVFEAAVPPSGELKTLSTGSRFAASRIAVLSAKGWLPRSVMVTELESASNPNQKSLWVTDAVQAAVGSGEQGY